MDSEKNTIAKLKKENKALGKKVKEMGNSKSQCLSLAQQLQRVNDFNNALLASIPFGMDIVDRDGNILFMNRKLEAVFGRKAVGRKCWDLYRDDKSQCEYCPLKKGIKFGTTATIESQGCLGGKALLITHTGMLFKRKSAILEIFQDITDKVEYEKKLQTLAIVDELTKLCNRRGFLTLADHQLRVAKRQKANTALFFLDLDNMKAINDSMGHSEGDKALKDAAGILKETARESDIIARLGGDEFAVLASGLDRKNSDIFTTRLQTNLLEHNLKADRPYRLSMSLGVADCSPEQPCSVQGLLDEADKLMYEQKRGRNRLFDKQG